MEIEFQTSNGNKRQNQLTPSNMSSSSESGKSPSMKEEEEPANKRRASPDPNYSDPGHTSKVSSNPLNKRQPPPDQDQDQDQDHQNTREETEVEGVISSGEPLSVSHLQLIFDCFKVNELRAYDCVSCSSYQNS